MICFVFLATYIHRLSVYAALLRPSLPPRLSDLYLNLFYAAIVALYMTINKNILNAASVALHDLLCPPRRVRPVVVVLCPSARSVVVVVRPLSVVSSPAVFFGRGASAT